MSDLKLIALDPEDLEVLSAHLQDAVVKVGEMAWLPKQRRFATVLNRFDWGALATAGTGGLGRLLRRGRGQPFQRRRTALRFERVLAARVLGFDLSAPDQVLSLLAIQFEPAISPGGTVSLIFAGGPAIRLDVECIEAELKDLGAAWLTQSRPDHEGADLDDTGTGDTGPKSG